MKNPLLLVDNYKLDHYKMYPEGMNKLYSNFTPRTSIIKDIDKVVVFGIQYFIKKYLINGFNDGFFNRSKSDVINEYKKHVKIDSYKHIEDLHDLGYLPIKLKALSEGTECPIGIPMLTITNTNDNFAWLVNYLETLISTQLWQPITSSTISRQYRKNIDKWSLKTTGTTIGNEWIGHDFSMRGMSSVETSLLSGMAHLLSFNGTDVVPAMYEIEDYYNEELFIGGGVPATEHSVMCMGTKEDEIETFKRLLKLYPKGILSVVSDTWDIWKVLNEYLPLLKDEILQRDGKLVIRPDSGKPIEIIEKSINILWDIFGGTINDLGYKVLDSHVGLIYGDGIGLHNLDSINEMLERNGFATTNWVAGFGSYGYQYNTRDTFGFAMKATYGEVYSVGREIYKEPVTDSGTKKSAKGLLKVYREFGAHGYSNLQLKQSCSKEDEQEGLLRVVFEDGKLIINESFTKIRSRLK